MASFREMMAGDEVVVAPLALTPLWAKLAEKAGFKALYVGGGGLGYLKCVTEANLALPEFVQVGVDIRSVCPLPLVLDGACGWGDPMHLHRTIGLSEAAGFSAIEIEDQILPKRVHHHVGTEHSIPTEAMVDKIKEAVAARRNPDFMIIARTNTARSDGIGEALRRLEAYKAAGADMLLSFSQNLDDVRTLGERLPGPLMQMIGPGVALSDWVYSVDDLAGLGYRLVVDALTPLAVMHNVLKDCYANIAAGRRDPNAAGNIRDQIDAIHDTIDLETLLAVERRTVEKN